MNKLVEQLTQQVGAASGVMGLGRRNAILFTEFELEEFAALIVEECAKRAEAYSYMSSNFTVLAEELRRMKKNLA
jgi:hypothetical protein